MSSTGNTANNIESDFFTMDFSRINAAISELTTKLQPFTGERYILGAGVQICLEHLHRYCLATSLIPSSATVLDIGCGIGYGSIYMSGFAQKVIAIDIDPQSTQQLHTIAQKHQLHNIEVHTVDIANYETFFNDLSDRITFVTCHELIEHLPEVLQKSLLKRIASGIAPFTPEVVLTLSTPEQSTYNAAKEQHNPFHLHELSKDEFILMINELFPSVSIYQQANGFMNIFKAIHKTETAATFFNLAWQNEQELIPAFGSSLIDNPEYLFAVASLQPHHAPSVSVLGDTSNQYIRERMAIAAKELRELSNKLWDQSLTKEELQLLIREEFNNALEQKDAEINFHKTVALRQAAQITYAQKEAERIGALNIQLQTQVNEMQILIERLKPWYAMASLSSLLGNTLKEYTRKVYRLISCKGALKSVGDRFIRRIGKIVRRVIPK